MELSKKHYLYFVYSALLAPFWIFIALRVFLPPNNVFTFLTVLFFLFLEYFIYPFATGFSIKFFYDELTYKRTSLIETIRYVNKRYFKLLQVFTLLFMTYISIALFILFIFGPSWSANFDSIERELDKFTFIWEGSILPAILNIFINVLHPVWFPVGIAAIINPSSGFILAAVSASLIAIVIMFYFVIRLSLWLPFITLSDDEMLHSIKTVWRIGGENIGNLFSIFFRSLGKLIVIYLILLSIVVLAVLFSLGFGFLSPLAFLLTPVLPLLGFGGTNTIVALFGRPFSWGYFIILTPYFVIIPIVISLYYQKLRVEAYIKTIKQIPHI